MSREHGGDEHATAMPGWCVPAGLFALAVLVRIGAALRTAVIFNDGPSFLEVAALFRAGDVAAALAHHSHPLYPALTALLAIPLGEPTRAGIAVSIIAGSAAVLALYAFLRRAFDPRTAWIGGVFFALQPSAAVFSADVQSEGLYFALFLASLAALWRALTEDSPRRATAAGALVGAAYLVRPEGLGLAVLGVAFGGLRVLRRRSRAPAFARTSAALLAGTAIVAAPYVLYLHDLTGEWRLTQKKAVSDLVRPVAPPQAPGPGVPDRPRGHAPGSLGDPVRAATVLPARVELEPRSVAALVELLRVSVSALHPLFSLLAIVGIGSLWGRPGDRGAFVMLVAAIYAVVLYGLALNVGYLDRRHALAPLLPLLGYAALGLPRVTRFVSYLLRPRAGPRETSSSLWLGIAAVALLTLPKTLAAHREERLADRRAAEWLLSREDLDGAVAAEKYRTAWYAGRAFVQLSRAGSDGDVVRLAREGARFLIVDDHQIGERKALAQAAPDLVLLYRVEAEGRTAFVYDLRALAAEEPPLPPLAAPGPEPE